MKGKTAIVLLSGLLFACTQPQPPQTAAPPPAPPPAPAPAPTSEAPPAERIVTIRRATCQALLDLSPDDRAIASMVYIGYQASRFRSATINVNAIPSMQSLAQTYCAAYPNRTVADAFADAYSLARR
jgi:hypothetical protein